mmetsp:Transcript_16785/g.31159  ORF Transcript_16785/g.31159 Transcript_16785/m.31159 type:complete len:195 (+) Transcript_16785:268-852(+)
MRAEFVTGTPFKKLNTDVNAHFCGVAAHVFRVFVILVTPTILMLLARPTCETSANLRPAHQVFATVIALARVSKLKWYRTALLRILMTMLTFAAVLIKGAIDAVLRSSITMLTVAAVLFKGAIDTDIATGRYITASYAVLMISATLCARSSQVALVLSAKTLATRVNEGQTGLVIACGQMLFHSQWLVWYLGCR